MRPWNPQYPVWIQLVSRTLFKPQNTVRTPWNLLKYDNECSICRFIQINRLLEIAFFYLVYSSKLLTQIYLIINEHIKNNKLRLTVVFLFHIIITCKHFNFVWQNFQTDIYLKWIWYSINFWRWKTSYTKAFYCNKIYDLKYQSCQQHWFAKLLGVKNQSLRQ